MLWDRSIAEANTVHRLDSLDAEDHLQICTCSYFTTLESVLYSSSTVHVHNLFEMMMKVLL